MAGQRRIDENAALNIFRDLMAAKLSANRNKPIHWSTLSISELFSLLEDEIKELKSAIMNGDNSVAVLNEAADVANFTMFISSVYQRNHEHIAKTFNGKKDTQSG
jgi:NTP pyrophosphatase (non-canonical NTP hydrolase)